MTSESKSNEVRVCNLEQSKGLVSLFAILCLAYHCQQSIAQTAEGCDMTLYWQVCWEYDLEHATGNISVSQKPWYAVELSKLTGLLPSNASIISTKGSMYGWGNMDEDTCSGMTSLIPGEPIAMHLHNQMASIEFSFPAGAMFVNQPVQVETVLSTPNCTLGQMYGATVENFVSVAPLVCEMADVEPDGDIDLFDFAEFQNSYESTSESIRIPCLEEFIEGFAGPTLSA